jgi:prepilin-type N-terminal cleavage/methylation domain-containing protein
MKSINKSGFSLVELLVTLVIATTFLVGAYQLFSSVMKDSGEARKESRASNVAYDYLRRYATGLSGSCTSPTYPTTVTLPSQNISEVGNAVISIVTSCPYASKTNIFKVTVSVSYSSPTNTVLYSTYESI